MPKRVVRAGGGRKNVRLAPVRASKRRSSLRSRALGRRRTGSKTKTKKHQRAHPMPDRAGTESRFSIKLRPKGSRSKVEKSMQIQTYSINSGAVLTSSTGSQASTDGVPLFSIPHLQSMLNAVKTQSGQSIGLFTTTMYMKSGWQEIMIENSTNAVARIQIWDLLAKRDCFTDHAGRQVTPTLAWEYGLADQGGAGDLQNFYGSRPTDSFLFNQFYKVKKVTYTDVAPGQLHIHRMHYQINRRVNDEIATQTNLLALKGWTLYPMIVINGSPIGNTGNTSATVSLMKCNITYASTYHFTFLDTAMSSTAQNKNLDTVQFSTVENLVVGAGTTFASV